MRLIGRAHEEKELTRLLHQRQVAGEGLITVVGQGGVGKTTLVRTVVQALDVGTVWVDLSARHEVQGARDALAQALCASDDGIVPALLRRGLVVLDSVDGLDLNPEHALAFARELMVWRRAAPTVQWLITSRRPMGLTDERVFELQGLSRSDAERLFVERVRARAPGFVMSETDHRWLDRLDGVPLAIRIAASRAALLGSDRIAHEGLDRLEWPAPDVEARHTSIKATVRWSIERLRPWDREFLYALAAFAGPFEVDDAVALMGEGAIAGLERLAAASLMTAGARLSLFEPVLEVIRPDARQGPFVRLIATRCEEALEQLYDGDPGLAHARLSRHAADLFQAWRVSDPEHLGPIGLGLAAHLTGRSLEAGRILDEVVRRIKSGPWHFKARFARARLFYLEGRLREAEQEAAHCLEQSQGDELLESSLLMSAIDRESGRAELARQRCVEVLAQAEHPALRAWARLHLASATLTLGRHVDAHELYLAALGEAREAGAKRVEALAVANLGFVAMSRGDLEAAALRFVQARELFERIHDPLLGAKVTVALARVTHERGQDAAALIAHAEEVAERLADRSTRIEIYLLRAEVLEREGRGHEAKLLLEEALATAVAAGQTVTADTIRAKLRGPSLRVGLGAWWFENGIVRVELNSRASLRRVLAALVERRVNSPGVASSTHDLVEAGWPGEHISAEAAADRVYTAIGTLRKMGLDGVLVRRDGGYALAPEVALVVVP